MDDVKAVIENLVRADGYLEKISVSGSDCYHMINARNALKSSFELLKGVLSSHVLDSSGNDTE